MAHFAPTDWAGAFLTYRALGDHTELVVMLRRVTDGNLYLWTPPADVAQYLARLRQLMYQEGRGTWFELSGTVALDGRIEVRYRWDDEPDWDGEPPPGAFTRELTRYPRDEGMVPDWFAARLSRPVLATLEDGLNPEEALRRAESVAAELEVDPRSYRVGEVADGAWCLVREDSRWAVFLALGEQQLARAEFATAEQAARYFVGHLSLRRDAFRDELPLDARRATEEWPIQPVGGDRGLNYYGGKRLVTVSPGTELDRYGDPAGNTVFAARTEFTHRSQPADEVHREYHVYRVLRSIRAVMGQVVPWHDQAGGGTAYVLERSVGDLLSSGALEEIPQATTRPSSVDGESTE
ncbi:TNT domain-containing protein [Saccharomonospora cyanea]|uniref:TNT domain-containing protein n=1 Tax=Saccharomonospora cyanea TaxID=40989 RepID=UPI001E4FAA62|nr:TNT domain-containing protein [Saccharomonospora cyanea]